ncbi:MAG TPA: zf-HC2 domain-containing protein [Polyangia bacterium]|nr:zf-HC2 domain-containing protein [Polyangia bacterium]
MSAPCARPISSEELVRYWAGDLDPQQTDRLDEHLMGCEICSRASERIAAVSEGVRAMIPVFVTRQRVAGLRARGLRIVENPVVAQQRKTAVFPLGADLLLHRLSVDLSRATAVEVKVRDESSGEVLIVDPRVPFDPTAGEILVACQRHFGEIARTILFEVSQRDSSGATQVSHFAIPHVFEAQPAGG